MNNKKDRSSAPLGLGYALIENTAAFKRFAALSVPRQQEVIENAHNVKTSAEMRAYVESIGKNGESDE